MYARKASRTADLRRQEQAGLPALEATIEADPQIAVAQAEATTAAAAEAQAAEAQVAEVATAEAAEVQAAEAAARAEAGEDKFFRNT